MACPICNRDVHDLDVSEVRLAPDGRVQPVYRACGPKRARRMFPLKPGTGYRAATLGPGFAVKQGQPSRYTGQRGPPAGAVVVYDGPLPGGRGRLRVVSTEPEKWRLRDRHAQALLAARLRFGTLAPVEQEAVAA